jgi:hypothetical protein
MSVITVRQLGPNNDPLWGAGQDNYISDQAAVAQIVLCRLQMFQGEWWANTLDGLPLWQSILGQSASTSSQEQIAVLITQRILGSPFIITVNNVQTGFNSITRQFTYSAQISTQFGTMVLSNYPQPPSGALT